MRLSIDGSRLGQFVKADVPSGLFEAAKPELLPLTGCFLDLAVESCSCSGVTLMQTGFNSHCAFVTFKSVATAAMAARMVHSVPQHKALLKVLRKFVSSVQKFRSHVFAHLRFPTLISLPLSLVPVSQTIATLKSLHFLNCQGGRGA